MGKGRKVTKRMSAWVLAGVMVTGNLVPAAAVYADTEDTQRAAAERVLELNFEGNVNDTSSKGNNGTIQGNGSEYVTGANETGQALLLKGNTYLDLGNDPSLNPSSLTVSFWVKPQQAMTGEQVFVWNKEEWYSDGWYVTSENDSTPLAISIGSADTNKQPYKVGVSGNRNSFFPVDEWTHVALSFDEVTKEVKIYRNGIRQKTTVFYNIGSDGADGTIDADNTMKKTVGYNGPKYNGGFVKGALDDMVFLNQATSQEEIISLYEETKAFDAQGLVDADADSISLPGAASSDLSLPVLGENGSQISWESNDKDVISDDGKVSLPSEGSQDVTMTATVSYKGKTATRPFIVTVRAVNLTNNGMDHVNLADAYLSNAQTKDIEYLLSLNSEKFLYEFYKVAGLEPTTDSGYQGWERSNDANFRGHFFGHYMSALSQAYLGCDDEATKAKLYEQLTAAVEGLKTCQDSYAAAHPGSAGYISAFPEAALDRVENGQSSNDIVYVPWYNLHKVLAGLIDVAKNVEGDLGKEALEVAKGFGNYIYTSRTSKWTDTQKNQMLRIEYGGMNEALYELYRITGDTNYKSAAECFDEVALFNELAAGRDVLNGKHANTTIPKFIGAVKRYIVLSESENYALLTEEEKAELGKYLTAAENFWDIVVKDHTYVTGGNSQSEHFREAGMLAKHADNRNCETCNTYNMLKLSRYLFQVTKDKKYMDYYEKTYINAILSSQDPETGMMMYFQPMASGYYKLYNSPEESFWCCTGTGVENFTKLGDTIYLPMGDDIYVNMYFSSTFSKGGVSITQEANMPNADTVKLTVNENNGKTLRLRVPDWMAGDAQIKKNGAAFEAQVAEGYLVFDGLAKGDTLEVTFPMEVTAVEMPDNANMVAFTYGPVVLSTGLGTRNMNQTEGAGILVYAPTIDSTAPDTITMRNQSVEEWKSDIKNNLLRIEDSEDGQVQFQLQGTDMDDTLIYTPHFMRHQERYGLYMKLAEPDSPELQKSILEKKEAQREKEVSSDYITNFDDNNIEAMHNIQSEKSGVGTYKGRGYRDASSGGWFSYDLKINRDAAINYLSTTYCGDDNGRSFEIYINGELFETERVTNAGPLTSDGFYTVRREIPEKYLNADTITVKFQSTGGLVGGLYGISINSDYDTNAQLKNLQFDKGKLTPDFAGDVKEYTLTVTPDTEGVALTAVTPYESGLVYIGDILFDNAQPRTIKLNTDSQTVELRTKAQDHKTETTYKITIVKEEPIEEVDKKELQELVDQVSGYKEADYTKESWSPFKEALEEARKVLEKEDASQEEVDAKKAELEKTKGELKEIEIPKPVVNKKELQELVDQVSGYKEADYTKESWNPFKEALEEARKVLEKEGASQEEVDAKMAELEKAKAKLKAAEIPTPEQTPNPKPTPTPEPTPTPQGQWILNETGWWYDNGDGTWTSNGWKMVNDTWYYFDNNGYMETGWLQEGDTWYYTDESGAMQTGWVQEGGIWYYTNESGAMQTGWVEEGNTWYYTNESGAMQTGWVLDGGTWYYTNESGAMQTGWVQTGGTWYYTNESGAMQTGWILSGDTWYYTNESGVMQTGWILSGDTWYYTNESGAMQTGWVLVGRTWYYLDDNGAMIKSTWIDKYYVNKSGAWTRTR